MGRPEHRPNRVIAIERPLEKKIDATPCHGSRIELLDDQREPRFG
jgi:hypothetical protein